MRKYIYGAALMICGVSLAQNPNLNQARPVEPVQTPTVQQNQLPAEPTVADRASQALKNVFTDWRIEDLPAAAQKAVREHSRGNKIADIDRETRTGRTVWEIEFEEAGVNREIHVAEDGTVIPETGLLGQTDRPGVQPGERPAATGTPAGAQTGRSIVAVPLGPQWDELPQAVQQKAMKFGGKEKVADIDRESWHGKVAYEIEFRREGRNLEIHFGEDGAILESNDPTAAPAQGTAPAIDASRSPSTPQQSGQPQPQTQPQPPARNNPPR